jgi:uncharacterized protein (TIGR02996 family)
MSGKPDDAWWDRKERAWAHGARDVQGRLVGEVRYWNREGVLIGTATYVDGKLHGIMRWHRPSHHLDDLPEAVVALEMVSEHGDDLGTQLRNEVGREVDAKGALMPQRPAGIEPTAHRTPGGNWWFSRRRGKETIEERSYDSDGTVLFEREFEERPKDRRWRLFYGGRLRCVGFYRNGEMQQWHGNDGMLEGRVKRELEIGRWSGNGRTVELGPAQTEKALLAHRVTAAVLSDKILGDQTLVGMLARARRAGIGRDRTLLGAPVLEIAKHPSVYADSLELVAAANALRWTAPDGDLLAGLAAALFRGNRAQAALDVLEAAFLFDDRPSWRSARIAYQRALGRIVEERRSLDARAHALLAQIRANPDDNGPRLVFADEIASTFPEHAELIVTECANRGDADIGNAFRASLPGGFVELSTVRGFIAELCLDTSAFLELDPELLERIAPACRSLTLCDPIGLISQLVTMPSLARFSELRLRTYSFAKSDAQLARCKYLDDLESLDLCDTEFKTILPAICGSFPRLVNLNLGGEEGYPPKIFTALGEAPFAPTLQRLTINNENIGEHIVKLIAKLPALEYLDLEVSALTDKGARGLLALPNRWTELRLADHQLSERMQKTLAARLGDRVRFTR